MSELDGATPAVLEGWLKAEREYLSSLKKEPKEETLRNITRLWSIFMMPSTSFHFSAGSGLLTVS